MFIATAISTIKSAENNLDPAAILSSHAETFNNYTITFDKDNQKISLYDQFKKTIASKFSLDDVTVTRALKEARARNFKELPDTRERYLELAHSWEKWEKKLEAQRASKYKVAHVYDIDDPLLKGKIKAQFHLDDSIATQALKELRAQPRKELPDTQERYLMLARAYEKRLEKLRKYKVICDYNINDPALKTRIKTQFHLDDSIATQALSALRANPRKKLPDTRERYLELARAYERRLELKRVRKNVSTSASQSVKQKHPLSIESLLS